MDEEVRIQPMLSVRGGARAVEFYKAAFGAVEAYRIEDPDGNVVARLAVGSAEFWVNDESPGHPSPDGLGDTTFRVILIVPDVDAIYARAIAAGAEAHGGVQEAHGWRTGRLADPFGHHWEISKPVGPGPR